MLKRMGKLAKRCRDSTVICRVSESADGRHIFSLDFDGNRMTWSRGTWAILRKSKNIERDSQNDFTYEENGSEKYSTTNCAHLKTK